MDVEQMLLNELGVGMKKCLDFCFLFTSLDKLGQSFYKGKPFHFYYRTEDFEYVDSQGNDTGMYGTHQVPCLIYKGYNMTIADFVSKGILDV